MSKMNINDSLTLTLFGKTRRAILAVLYGHADETFYLRQIARIAGGGMGAVQREVKALADAGIIKRIVKGRRIYYQANIQCAVFAELKSIIMKTAGVGDSLKTALIPLADRIRAAFIYGSLARGNESNGSDVDIFVIGEVTFAEIVGVFSPIQQTLNREINPTVYLRDEFREKRAEGNHFIKSVMEGSKLFLIGDEHDLEELAS